MNRTPGRWKCGDDEPFVYALNERGTNRFYTYVQPGVRGGSERTPREEVLANAHLMAAAPDLLALLIESQTSIGGNWRERRDEAIEKLTAKLV